MFKKLATVVILIYGASANAATYNINLVVDLVDQYPEDPYHFYQVVPTYLPQLQTGDVVYTNVSFAGGKRLHLEQTSLPDEFYPFGEQQRLSLYYSPTPGVATGTPANITTDSTTELLGLDGQFEQTNPYNHIGGCTYCAYAGIDYVDMTDSAFSFSGISITYVIDLYDPVGVNYEMTQFEIRFRDNSRNHEISTISSVPVPGAFWLFISSLIVLVGVKRKK